MSFFQLDPPINYIVTLVKPFFFVWYVIPLLKAGVLASICDLFLRFWRWKHQKKRCSHVQFILSNIIFARWWHPVASSEALDLLHWAICAVTFRRIAIAIKTACFLGVFVDCCLFHHRTGKRLLLNYLSKLKNTTWEAEELVLKYEY